MSFLCCCMQWSVALIGENTHKLDARKSNDQHICNLLGLVKLATAVQYSTYVHVSTSDKILITVRESQISLVEKTVQIRIKTR